MEQAADAAQGGLKPVVLRMSRLEGAQRFLKFDASRFEPLPESGTKFLEIPAHSATGLHERPGVEILLEHALLGESAHGLLQPERLAQHLIARRRDQRAR